MKKLAYVTNIPTPYRDFRFRILKNQLEKQGIELEVLYMAKTEPGRNWDAEILAKGYKAVFFKNFGINISSKRMFIHFNPGLFLYLLRSKFDYVIVGGISSPTHILSPYFTSSSKCILSVESNLNSERSDNRILGFIKEKIIKKYDYFQVTGKPSVAYIEKYYGDKLSDEQVIYLKNLINEEDFLKSRPLKLENDKIHLVIIGRLERVKGIEEFLHGISLIDHSNINVSIVGEGSQYDLINEYIKEKQLPAKLIGHIKSDEISNWLNSADAFVLPSISDPSPLSPIEALYLGKPLLVSDRIGNLNDVLVEGKNGFKFDIFSKETVAKSISKFISLSDDEKASFSASSVQLYIDNFDPEKQIEDYIRKVIS
ncbi:glycosyltransferase family 4 protein [Vibrio breoganii]|uniref:glycosyltransferase family 4 protein n=1 Tax=Vibrio breoganii TaxID=553239 RepID=UPI000C85E2D1|nr:glycosyltransferase family 4 protein [Vibrio breoganii]PMK42634.1 hypothetical protein BCU00_12505 [Vibrio breoganii]